MAKPIELKVHIALDEPAKRWYVARSDIPGMRLEADTPEQLIGRIAEAAPELLALNEPEILAVHRNAVASNNHRSVKLLPVFDMPMHVAYAACP